MKWLNRNFQASQLVLTDNVKQLSINFTAFHLLFYPSPWGVYFSFFILELSFSFHITIFTIFFLYLRALYYNFIIYFALGFNLIISLVCVLTFLSLNIITDFSRHIFSSTARNDISFFTVIILFIYLLFIATNLMLREFYLLRDFHSEL